MNYEQIKKLTDRAANSFAQAVDYEVAWGMAEKIKSKTTTYKGKGRPRKTDCDVWKHPFDGKLRIIH